MDHGAQHGTTKSKRFFPEVSYLTNYHQSGETGLVRIKANENRYGKNKDGTFGKKNQGLCLFLLRLTNTSPRLLLCSGHYLIFQANYKTSANMDCSPSFSHIESPWIEQSLPHCILQFNFTSEHIRVTSHP